MTYEELLEEINDEIKDIAFHKVKHVYPYLAALRAVVELHNPKHPWSIPGDEKCMYCSHLDFVDYPCATISAIEKELSNG